MAGLDILAFKIKDKIPAPEPRPGHDPAEDHLKWNNLTLWWGHELEDKAKDFSPTGTQPASPDDPDWRGVVQSQIIPLKRPEPYDFGAPFKDHYFWFDTPDYADPFKKLGYAFKFFTVTGLFAVTTMAICSAKPLNFQNSLLFFRTFLGPYLGASMTGATTVVTVANLRGKKDDTWNYTAGAIAYASVYGRSSYHSFCRSLVVGSIAIFFKHNSEINGWMSINPFSTFKEKSWGLSMDTKHGWKSGDLRFGWSSSYGDPGRDTRRVY